MLQPDCLRWARERARLDVPALAQKMGIKEEKIVTWEQSGEITWSLVQKLAKDTHTPLGYLFLPSRPSIRLPIKDFRTVESKDISDPTPELIDVVNDALMRQDWYRDYIINNGGEPLPFVGSLRVSTDIVGSANRIREQVAWRTELRETHPSSDAMLTRYIRAVEGTGILVMRSGVVGNNTHRSLDVNEFRGFALSDEYAPIIFINSKDAKAAQLFTLAHELVHIWVGISGITNLRQTYSPDIEAERFCNRVAAELLVPSEEFRRRWRDIRRATNTITDGIEQAARYFRVSSFVILRCLLDANFISPDDFHFFYDGYQVKFANQKSPPKKNGGDFFLTLQARLGAQFLSALVSSTLGGETPYREAFDLLGVSSVETIRDIASKVGVNA